MKKAINSYAASYAKYLETITIGGDKKIALSYAIQDMINQVKNLPSDIAIKSIEAEVEYLEEKMSK